MINRILSTGTKKLGLAEKNCSLGLAIAKSSTIAIWLASVGFPKLQRSEITVYYLDLLNLIASYFKTSIGLTHLSAKTG